MAHVQGAGHVGRRNHDREVVLRRALGRRIEGAAAEPGVEDARLDVRRVPAGRLFEGLACARRPSCAASLEPRIGAASDICRVARLEVRLRRIMDGEASNDERAVCMRRAVIAGIAGLMALAMPTSAGAATIKHEGTIADQAGAQVKFAVKKNDGQLQKVTNLRFNRVPVTCDDGTSGEITAQLPSFGLGDKENSPVRGRFREPESATARCAHSARSAATARRPAATFASPSSPRRARAAGPASSTGRRRSAERRLQADS